MDHTAYLILEYVDPGRIRVVFFRFLPSLASTSRGETDREEEEGFTVATETVSSLLNTCFW